MSTEATAVRLEGVTKHLGGRVVLDDVAFDVRPGEAVVLLGPSGCGKTTLLRTVAGLDAPDRGRIYLDGQLASDGTRLLVAPHARGIGFVFQDLALWPHLSVTQHLAFVLESLSGQTVERDERIRSALDWARLDVPGHRRPHQLSGGQQQRLALARALVGRPRVLLLDEPFSSLDTNLRQEVRHEVAQLQSRLGLTMIAVTHDPEDARVLGQRVVRMEGGRLREEP
jgi:ABC-type Fe3+/spermidine/putrescine transport system ATPase subunit